MTRAARWRRFYLVGVIGFVFQLAVLFVLAHWTRLAPSLAVALAVIITVSHNFLWHERVTWPDRPVAGRLRRWVAFQLSTGIISVATGVGLTVSLTRITGLPVVAANAIAVGMASVATFLVSDLLVYRRSEAAAQNVEHYEISADGTSRALAGQIGRPDVAKLLGPIAGRGGRRRQPAAANAPELLAHAHWIGTRHLYLSFMLGNRRRRRQSQGVSHRLRMHPCSHRYRMTRQGVRTELVSRELPLGVVRGAEHDAAGEIRFSEP